MSSTFDLIEKYSDAICWRKNLGDFVNHQSVLMDREHTFFGLDNITKFFDEVLGVDRKKVIVPSTTKIEFKYGHTVYTEEGDIREEVRMNFKHSHQSVKTQDSHYFFQHYRFDREHGSVTSRTAEKFIFQMGKWLSSCSCVISLLSVSI